MHSHIVFSVLFVDAAFPYEDKVLLPQYLLREVYRKDQLEALHCRWSFFGRQPKPI